MKRTKTELSEKKKKSHKQNKSVEKITEADRL